MESTQEALKGSLHFLSVDSGFLSDSSCSGSEASADFLDSNKRIDSNVSASGECASDCSMGQESCGEDAPSHSNVIDSLPRSSALLTKSAPVVHEARTEPSLQELMGHVFEVDENGNTVLHLALSDASTSVCFSLIRLAEEAALLDTLNYYRQTPLHIAVALDKVDVTRRLVIAGARVDVQDRNGNTPLHIACATGNLQCVQALLDDISPSERLLCQHRYHFRGHSLSMAARERALRIVNFEGYTCLHLAVLSEALSVVQYLAASGVDVNMGDFCRGFSSLHFAATTGHERLVDTLTQHGADPCLESYGGLQPFSLAKDHGQLVTAVHLFSLTSSATSTDLEALLGDWRSDSLEKNHLALAVR